jgi:hypothetical protein
VSLKTLSIGISPLEYPFVPLIYESEARTSVIATPIPPADFEIIAIYFKVSKIPSIESSFMLSRKQELICGFGVPELKRVGVA